MSPAPSGFIGKFQLIHALVDGHYTWLAIVLVVGSMISLGYYLRVVAAIWMSPAEPAVATSGGAAVGGGLGRPGGLAPIAGGSPEADALAGGDRETVQTGDGDADPEAKPVQVEVVSVAVVFAAACIVFGIIPGPLFHLASHAGAALTGIF